MSRRIKKYQNKKILTRSASESMVNALFARNLFARNLKQADTKHRKRLEISNLPPVDANHGLLQDSDTSFHVNRGLNNTFDRLKDNADPFDKLKRSKDTKTDLTHESTQKNNTNMFLEDSIPHLQGSHSYGDGTSHEIFDFGDKNDLSKFREEPNQLVCSTPINKKSQPLADAGNLLEKSMQQIHNWSYIPPDVSVYIPVPSVRRKLRSRRCKAINGYKLDHTTPRATLDKTTSSFVAMKFASNQSLQSLDSRNVRTEDTSDNQNSSLNNKSNMTPFKESSTSVPTTNSKKTDFTLDDFENFTKSLSVEEITTNYDQQDGEFDYSSMKFEETKPRSRRTQTEEENTEDKSIITVENFEKFYNSVRDTVIITEDCGEINESCKFEEARANTSKWVNKKRRKLTVSTGNNETSTSNHSESSADANRFVTRRVLRSSTRSSKKISECTESSTIQSEKYSQSKRFSTPVKISKCLEIDSPDLFATEDELSNIQLQISVDSDGLKDISIIEEDIQVSAVQENVSAEVCSNLINSECKETCLEPIEISSVSGDDRAELTEQINNSENLEFCNLRGKRQEEQTSNDFKTKVSTVNKTLEESTTSECDQLAELPNVCLNQRKNTIKPIQILPGKSWRRSLATFKRKTQLKSQDLQGEKCSYSDCPEVNQANANSLARRTRFTLSAAQPVATHRKTQYERDRHRETAQLEALIENISLNVSQLSTVVAPPSIFDRPRRTQEQRQCTASDLVLQRCHQKRPLKFSKCYNDTILRNCQKIGEGVYGEVFLYRKTDSECRTTVMKVIPIEGEMLVNGERQKQFDEILSEIVIAGELSGLRTRSSRNRTAGFNQLQRVRCVQGAYPARLIDLWELFEEAKGTENDNPNTFEPDQRYVVLELANAGSDLESFIFTNFIEVYHVFLQVALSLAVAEAELQFEHRDLHWGNVLIQRVAANKQCDYLLHGQSIVVPTTSVEASIIDFTLSRISYDNINFYNDLSQDPDLFNAEGDYQFEIYKLMQIANCNEWEAFQPKTNILWLHYLLDKMTSQLRMLRKQAGRAQKRILIYWAECILNYSSALEFVEKVVLPHLAQS